jgi:hypothetical protein
MICGAAQFQPFTAGDQAAQPEAADTLRYHLLAPTCTRVAAVLPGRAICDLA